ncbi:hypothetical protein K1T71_007863 [Dendrolimus kikuchii]|uniref:Uncharacterized protein n=1 Tax=Dendrolimus kikuchii TaxID=765133 RepID=A0ACC1CY82_9NEOP|nr:hypothetical protein K1T71_007863 [Dendrolimus kikuchii]
MLSVFSTADLVDDNYIINIIDGLVSNLNVAGATADGSGVGKDASLPVGGGSSTPDMRLPPDCNDGERAILQSYMSLIRQCMELVEKVGAVKA